MFVDLHVHTCLSDGSDTVAQVSQQAKENGLTAISITDHNTVAAYQGEELKAAEALGLTVIPGVEIDVIHNGRSHHMLGLGVDVTDRALLDLCADSAEKQERYNLDLLALLERDVPGVSKEAYDRYEIPAGRGGWKLLNYLLDMGVTRELREGLRFYMQYGFNVNTIPFVSLQKAAQVVKSAGGIPIIAHPGEDIPYSPYEADHSAFWAALESVLEAGVQGVECIHPVHDFELEQELLAFCEKRGLLISGGSDYHGQFFSRAKAKVGGQFVRSETAAGLLTALGVQIK